MNSKKLLLSIWALFSVSLLVWMLRFWANLPAFMDTLEYVFPEKSFNVQSFQQGLIPLWNPYIACGTPHVANFQSAAFYPPFWIWNLTGLTHWFFIVGLSHALLAAVGFYFWLRSLKVRELVATLCAVSWGGSAYLTFLWGFPTHLASLTWIPWILWASFRLLEKRTWGRWLFLSVVWVLQILAGYPIFSFYALLFWIIYLAVKIKREVRIWLWFAGAFAAAGMITACQWLPFLDLLGYMHRGTWGTNVYNLKLQEYLSLFWPNILGTPGTADYRGEYGNFIFGNFYLGLIPLVLLVWSFWKQKKKLDFWQKSLIFWFFLPMGSRLFILWLFPNEVFDKLEVSKASFVFSICAFTIIALFLNKTLEKAKKKSWIRQYGWIFILIWLLDVILVPMRIVPLVPDPYQNAEVKKSIEQVKAATGDGRMVSLRIENEAYSSAVSDYAGAFQETAERLTPNSNVVWGIRSAQGDLTTMVDGYQNLFTYMHQGFPYSGRVLDGAGVKLILSSELLPGFKYKVHEPQGSWNLIHNAGAMPNIWEVDREKNYPDRPESFGSLLDPKAFLEEQCAFDLTAEGKPMVLAPAARSLCEVPSNNSPCAFQFDVPAAHGHYFIFDQCFAPGWHAWVDGAAQPIFRANGLWMAVELNAQAPHRIFFQYSPISFRLGAFLSLLALAFFFLLGMRLVLARRSSK